MPLHAKLSPEEQDKISEPYEGLKIIVSTNVAQTSLTIDGVDVVIDSGQERHVDLDLEGVEGLGMFPCSQADCDQRAGRTGRVGPGTYILTRYNHDAEYVSYISRPKFAKAEILRTDLDRTTLRTMAAGIDLAELSLFHPIDKAAVHAAKEKLWRLGAIDDDGELTSVGRRMNEFPVQPSSARMLVESYRFSPIVRAHVSAIVSSLEVGGLPYFAHNVGKAWAQLTDETSSDLLAQLDIFIATQDLTDRELTALDLDVRNLRRAQELHRKIVHRTDAYDGDLIPPNEDEKNDIRKAVFAGLADWVYRHVGDGNYARLNEESEEQREISNRSVVSGKPGLLVGSPYRVEYFMDGEARQRHIIENITVLEDPRILVQ